MSNNAHHRHVELALTGFPRFLIPLLMQYPLDFVNDIRTVLYSLSHELGIMHLDPLYKQNNPFWLEELDQLMGYLVELDDPDIVVAVMSTLMSKYKVQIIANKTKNFMKLSPLIQQHINMNKDVSVVQKHYMDNYLHSTTKAKLDALAK